MRHAPHRGRAAIERGAASGTGPSPLRWTAAATAAPRPPPGCAARHAQEIVVTARPKPGQGIPIGATEGVWPMVAKNPDIIRAICLPPDSAAGRPVRLSAAQRLRRLPDRQRGLRRRGAGPGLDLPPATNGPKRSTGGSSTPPTNSRACWRRSHPIVRSARAGRRARLFARRHPGLGAATMFGRLHAGSQISIPMRRTGCSSLCPRAGSRGPVAGNEDGADAPPGLDGPHHGRPRPKSSRSAQPPISPSNSALMTRSSTATISARPNSSEASTATPPDASGSAISAISPSWSASACAANIAASA